jgi:glutamate carboxypeptidase
MHSYLQILVLMLGALCASAQAGVSATEKRMLEFIDATNPEALELLIESVNINSGTMNLEGVRKTGELFRARFEELGFQTEWQDGAEFQRAGHLVARYAGTDAGPKILLIGHLDTVFEPDSPFQSFAMLDDAVATGPGIADMKGGNVIMLRALAALRAVDALDQLDVTVVLTGDEELSGRPLALSKKALVDAAGHADIAIGFENGDGDYRTANISRRGASGWTLRTTGKPSHSSQIFREDIGPGAIFEAARILHSFQADEELRGEQYLTFNPGRIVGGTTITDSEADNTGTAFGKSNVVAESAFVDGDLRAVSSEQLQRARQRMQQIVASSHPHTSATIEFEDGYPPMAPTDGNRKLLALYSRVSEDLGFGAVEAVNPLRAGAADVSFVADHVEMAIDGVGMSGSEGHTVDEKGHLESLPLQAKRAAVLLYRLAQP